MFQESGKAPNIYLLEADPFYFYYLTQNIVDHGKMAEIVKGSKYFDSLMTAPFRLVARWDVTPGSIRDPCAPRSVV